MAWPYKRKGSNFWWFGWRVGKAIHFRSIKQADRREAEKELAKVQMLFTAHRTGTLDAVYQALSGKIFPRIGELKFIGDGHWSVSRLKPGTGRLDYHMGGTYTLDGDEYVETVEYGTGGPIGETYTYRLTVEGDRFTQMGVANPWSLVFKRAQRP